MTALLDRIVALLDENQSLCLDSPVDVAVLAGKLVPFVEAEVLRALEQPASFGPSEEDERAAERRRRR
jgi:hypothetical protein